MAEINITSFQAGQAANETLKQAATKLQTAQDSAKSGFSALAGMNPDMGSKFASELDGSLADMIAFLNTLKFSGDDYFSPPGGGYTSGGGYSPGGGNPTGGDNPSAPDPTQPPTEVPTEPGDGGNQVDGSSLKNMKASELDGFLGTLIALAEAKNKGLDEIISDDKYADDIKKLLLESPYVPQEFKDLIKDMDSKVVLKYLKSLLTGKTDTEVFGLNSLNLGIIFSYLEEVAAANNISVEQLLSDVSHAGLLKNTLSDLHNVIQLFNSWENMSPEEFQSSLLKLYDGDQTEALPQEDVFVARSFVDYISQESEIPDSDLLTDKSYASTLQKAAQQFTKTMSFFHTSSKFTTKGMIKNTRQMFNGKNYKALGMSDSNLSTFKQEMEALAKSNNTTVDKLLTDSSYAEIVSAALNKSNSAKGVGSIFKKLSSTFSQKVAKNLYNTKIQNSEFSDNDENEDIDFIPTSIGNNNETSDETPVTDEMVPDETPVTDEMVPDETPVTDEMVPDETPVTDEMIPDETPVTDEMVLDETPVTDDMTLDNNENIDSTEQNDNPEIQNSIPTGVTDNTIDETGESNQTSTE